MTKLKLLQAGICLAAILFVLGVTGCPSSTEDEKSNDASLTSLTVAGKGVTLSTPITGTAWDAADDSGFFSLINDKTAELTLTTSEMSDAPLVAVPANSKATVGFATGSSGSKPADADFEEVESIRLINNGYLFIRVTAEDRATVKYYCVKTASISSNTAMSSIKIGSGAAVPYYNSMAAVSVEAITEFASIKLSSTEAANAPVTLTANNAFRGTIKIAKVAKGGAAGASASFADYDEETTKFTFTHEDEIYIQMTAEDGVSVRYYGAKIEIGTDATLKSITFGSQDINEAGTPATSLAGITAAGYILMESGQPNAGFQVTVTANDPAAIVIFGNTTTAESTWTATARSIRFEDGEYLGVKVTAQRGTPVNYYKISVELLPTMNIPFGTPELYATADGSDTDYVDPIWDGIPWIPVAKQNRAETDDEFFTNPDTKGNAKLYWDQDGLWLYVDVETQNISKAPGFEHTGSSVELFINEAYPIIKQGNYNNIGGQYRLNSSGERSGDPDAAVAAFNNLNKYKTWRTQNTDGTARGYAVMFQAPWRFSATYPIDKEKSISLEVQINAANKTMDGRVGVLKWYNTVANTYQNAAALAPGLLDLLPGQSIPPQKPTINTQPVSQIKPSGGSPTAFTVDAVSPDGGQLSYQWYSATGPGDFTGTLISGATSASYTPTAVTATSFYYVTITNTKDGGTSTVNSAMVKVYVAPATAPANITVNFTAAMLGANASPTIVESGKGYKYTTTGYGQTAYFKLNLGNSVLADFSKISFTVLSEGSDANNKACFVNGSLTTALALSENSSANVTSYTGTPQNITTEGSVDIVLDIDKTKTLNIDLGGEIYLCVYIHSSGGTYTVTNFKIYNE